MNCKLCLVKPADKKGSHIVPAFILKTLFERNKEFVVSIGSEAVENHIGRELTPEQIEDYMGRELTDEEIDQNYIPFIEDNIFCSDCEKKLGHLESMYADKIHKHLSKKECDKDEIFTFNNDLGLISLFWYSVILRFSLATHNKFKLKDKEHRAIRNYLNNNLKENIPELKIHVEKNINLNCPYPLGIFFNSNAIKRLSSNSVLEIPKYRNPYFLLFNEYIIILYNKASQVNGMKHSFFDLEKSFDPLRNINYNNNEECNICIIRNGVWEGIKTNIFELFAKFKHQEFIDMFRFVAEYSNLAFTKANIVHFVNRILYEDSHIADRYDRTRVLTILAEELNQLPKISR